MKGVLYSLQILISLIFLQGVAFAADEKGQNQAYFTVLNDVPLMPGMTEMTDRSFIFDKAEGRVVETVGFLSASSSLDPQKYYEEALSQLGWKALKTGVFRRNAEQLVLKTEKVSKGIRVSFQLSPLSR